MAGCTAAGKGLGAYLALPLDQYSLLDPRWISKPDANDEGLFLLTVRAGACKNEGFWREGNYICHCA